MFEKEREIARQYCKSEDCECCDHKAKGDVANEKLVCAAELAFSLCEERMKTEYSYLKGQRAHLSRNNVILDVELLPDLDSRFGRCLRNGFMQVFDKTEWSVKLYKE